VIDTALGNDKARLFVPYQATTNAHRPRVHQAVQPPSTMRFAPVM
jgi:hypothetical protein